MVKTDDYMDNGLTTQTQKFEEHLLNEEIRKNENVHNHDWLTSPRSKSTGLAEYESDENQQKMASLDSGSHDDRRIRRQIANCNERRRMQSINAGFQSLRQLLPCKDGDKMSKASILAATADFIQNLLLERDKLLEENAESAAKRRKMNFGEQNGAPTLDECIKTIEELRILLQNETYLRMKYEKELFESKGKTSENNLNERTSPSSKGTISTSTNLFCQQQPVINNANNNFVGMGNVSPQNDAVRMTNILSSPLFSIASTAGVSNAVAAQQLIKAVVAVGKGINENNNYNNNPTSHLILEQQKHQQILNNSPQLLISPNIKNDQQTGVANNLLDVTSPNSSGGGGLNASLSISQRNLQSLVLAIRHLEGST
uniref:BHLH domain-containing protein n=1 Tax=Meloidogyne incognita TaxID=6306 RepID=A0A914LB33_MELIC